MFTAHDILQILLTTDIDETFKLELTPFQILTKAVEIGCIPYNIGLIPQSSSCNDCVLLRKPPFNYLCS